VSPLLYPQGFVKVFAVIVDYLASIEHQCIKGLDRAKIHHMMQIDREILALS
jgi:hypothetical protein